jgi:phytoene dehydrogenase-like protein
MPEKYDAIVIGAGMSGLAATIRFAMFNKKVCLLEQHAIPGGLNSYYRRGPRKLDVGLHAMTNYSEKGNRRSPLGKLLKQLRLPYDILDLSSQSYSSIAFPSHRLKFSNEKELLFSQIEKEFPSDIDGFKSLWTAVETMNIGDLKAPWASARSFVKEHIKNPVLEDMIFCPVFFYGSAWEDDMDRQQFAIMFQSVFMEGFCRPNGGIRPLLKWLVDTIKEQGGDLKYRCGVEKIIIDDNGQAKGVVTSKGEEIHSDVILSSMGRPETERLLSQPPEQIAQTGSLGFTETILFHDNKPKDWGVEDTIIFWNDRDHFDYKDPNSLMDPHSAVVCFPNNFERDDQEEGICRVTRLASYGAWKDLDKESYLREKELVEQSSRELMKNICSKPIGSETFKDTFTPLTIEHYTRHFGGAIYGSPDKSRDGSTCAQGLHLIGTDQGFLGIVGAMLSGISIANQHLR